LQDSSGLGPLQIFLQRVAFQHANPYLSIYVAVANSFSGAAQPALLYLVPAVLCGGSLAAVQRGEFRALLDYRDRAGLEEAVPEPIEVTNSDKLMK
jgi:hypothetical protein